MPVVSSF